MGSIDLISFLRNYYYISHPSLTFNKLRHEDIQVLFPFIQKCRELDLEQISKGDIIGVYDKDSCIMYYYNPHIYQDEWIEIYQEDSENITFDISNIDNLSKDELLKIRRKLRMQGLIKQANLVNKMIRKRKKEEPHAYRKKKMMLIKESYYD